MMKLHYFPISMCMALSLSCAAPAIEPPKISLPPGVRNSMTAQEEASMEDKDIPSKWFQGARGYEKAVEIQQELDVYMLIYFARPNTKNEKGLCKWFESKALNTVTMRPVLRKVVKVRVDLPGNAKNEELAKKFWVNKTPALYVTRPDGWRYSVKVFDWTDSKPELKDPEEIATYIEQQVAQPTKKGETYQPPEQDPGAESPAP
ncbi:MAG: hypothetical protein EOM20_01005 [Spartobacteria bacterium]|nr:hypothetical protein [Spartobacteria bacterium]